MSVDSNSYLRVPFEWKRDIIDGRVVYVTPNNYVLWSLQEIVTYLQTEGTCKCGLECPLILNKIFNFDPRLSSKAYSLEECMNDGSTELCNHRRKNIALATYQNSTAMIAEAQNLQNNLQNVPVYRSCDLDINYVPVFRPSFHSEKYVESRLNDQEIWQLSVAPDSGQSISNNLPSWTSIGSSSNANCESTCPPSLPPISVPNASNTTTAVNEVIPTVGIAPQILNTNSTGCPEVLQLLNPIQFASVAPNTVTVLQSGPTVDGATILIPQLMQSSDQQVVLSSAGNVTLGQPSTTVINQIEASGFTSIPLHQPFKITHAQTYARTLNSLVKAKPNRVRKKKENRRSRHPPTVAAILREAEEKEKTRKEEIKKSTNE